MRAVAFRPTPNVMLIQSAKLSPTVVHRILMTQNHTVTSGTLLNITCAVVRPACVPVCSLTRADRIELKLNAR